MATILITGGTGMIGKRLSQLLIEKGYEILILTRSKNVDFQSKIHPSVQKRVSFAIWDIENQTIDREAICKQIILSIWPERE